VAKEVNARDAKLIQYLNEAYGKEKQLETALQAHISLTTRPPYKKRLQEHLKETKQHAKLLERRVKKLGGTPDAGPDIPGPAEAVANLAGRAVAAAQGPLHALRGTGEAEKMLKNAKDEYHEEAEEIANYTAIEALADLVGDKETAKIAKGIKREEERMAKFLEKLIPQLTKAVAQEEIPAAERKPAGRSRSASSRSRSSSSRSSSSRSGGSSRSSSSRSGGSSRSSSSGSGSSSRSRGGSSSSRSGSGSSSRSRSSSSGSGSSSTRKSSGSSSSSRKSSGSASGSRSRSSSSRSRKTSS
jgi:ferritin-like metal-binding protein YciE